MNRRSLRCVLAAVFALSPATVATAATKFWKESVVTGSWNTGNNWSAVSATSADNGGVPIAGEPVRIVHANGVAHTVTLNTSTPTLGLLSIDLTGPGTTTNTLSIASNVNLTAGGIDVGGNSGFIPTSGRGAINQSAGTVTSTAGLDISVGNGAGSTGTYTLSGAGALVVPQSLFVGLNGNGTFNHSGGTNTISAGAIGALVVGAFAGSTGTYNLSGTGQLITRKSIIVGDNGTGIFNHSGGFIDMIGSGLDLQLGFGSTGNGTYTMSNNAGVFVPDSLVVGASGTGTFNIQDQAAVAAGTLSINASSSLNLNGGTLSLNTVTSSSASRINWNAGKITLSGARNVFADVTAATLFRIDAISAGITTGKHGEVVGMATFDGGSEGAIFNIKDGGVFTSSEGRIGYNQFGQGVVNVIGPGSVWNISSGVGISLVVGGQGISGALNIRNGGLVTTNYDVLVDTNGTVNLDGGALRFRRLNPNGGNGVFNFYSGTVQLIGDRTIGADDTIAKIFGGAPTLTSGKELSIEGAATLLSVVTLDGGTLTAPAIVNGQNLSLQRGRLNITNQAVTVGSGGLLGSTLDLNDDTTVNVTLGLTNQGLVTGDGQIGGTFANAAAGELRAEPGKSLKLTGGTNTNAGQINLYGGMLDFTQNLTNNAGAFISGNGTLKTGAGLVNNGTMNFSGLANVVGDVTNAATGKIISSGGGPTTFLDDVVNQGEIRTSAGSFTVLFGAATGAGAYTGTGTVNFEGDLKPGNSAAAINFAGDVAFGLDATLEIEIGGTTAGSGYDRINVADQLSLSGTLEVALINGFNPAAGHTFDLLNWGALSGTFASLNLPALAAGLAWNTSQLYTTGVLSVTTPGFLEADFDEDGDVDGDDLTQWEGDFGVNTLSDADNDGDSDGADFLAWQRQLGSVSTVAAGGAVPEPTGWMLVALSLLGGALGRRRC